RIEQMRAEGVEFRCNAWIGKSVPTSDLDAFDAILLTIGSTRARELDIPGSKLDGIHLAMDFLPQQNRRCAGKPVQAKAITAKGKNVVVLGGGDTGSDCVGTCIRQGAKRIWSLELLPRPPFERDDTMLWPLWPMILRASSSHQEGGERQWSVLTKEFVGEHGRVRKLKAVKLEWSEPDAAGRRTMKEIPASAFEIECDLVLLALGFLHPEHDTIVSDLGLELDARGNIKTNDDFQTSRPNVFSAGDARRGQSLVVWAIQEGREAARCIDVALMGCSELPAANAYHWPDACGSHVRASSLG
ncbi:MAG TPA: FAD-dependent oxidoreductase, partial [Candidatus Hydrogenedentes bacterium]|nr:FAD-dependent oxidoreductase [Candidatus Hydrogenedentota bacterium]